MYNKVINRVDTSVLDEDCIPGVIIGKQFDIITIGYIFEGRAEVYQYLLNLLEMHTYNESGYEVDKDIQEIYRRIVNS